MQLIKTFFKIHHTILLVAMLAMMAGLTSCKREIVKPELVSNYEINDFKEAFTAFWTGINNNYLFWDADPINWDSMYHVYKPRFDSLASRPYNDTSLNQCFQFMADMTKDLKDGQYSLLLWQGGNFRLDDSLYKSYISFAPKYFRTERVRPALPDTLFDYIIQNNYLKDFDFGVSRNYNTGQVFQIITGRLKKGTKNVLYAGLNNFAIKESYNSSYPGRPTRPVIKNLFDNIRKSNCDAIIIDLRNNRGGNQDDLDFLVGQFTSKPFVFGYARYKSGSGRLDYTPLMPMRITPQAGSTDFKKQIIILSDLYSAALCETVILAFKALPEADVKVIGERSFGTSGFVSGNEISTNGGTFSVGSFAGVRLSTSAFQDIHHQFNFSGIAPDVEIKYDAASIQQMLRSGVDIQMEKAIQYINK